MKKRFLALSICLLMILASCTGGSDITSSQNSSDTGSSGIQASSEGVVLSSDVSSNVSSAAESSKNQTASSSTSSKNTSSSNTSSKNNSSVNSAAGNTSSNASSNTGSNQKPVIKDDGITHIIMMSDLHLCNQSWYGMTSDTRINKMVTNLNSYMQKDPFDALMILGDTSLDFWENTTYGGSYRRHGISNTRTLIELYLSRIDCDKYIVPGNHEQYSNSDWKNITGRDRQFSVYINGWLFVMLDTFAGDLDPDYDHHGTYTGVDVDFLKKEMAKYPNAPVVLCAHYFYTDRESAEFKNILKNEKRIVCLFEGHDHVNKIDTLDASLGSKKVYHLGNFSYTGSGQTLQECSWGWRNVYISDDGIKIDYYTPKNILDGGKTVINEGIKQGPYFIDNPMKK